MDEIGRMVFFRNKFLPGDVRIKFEYVQQPYINVLAQQVQTTDDVFRLRPWNPFSRSHLSAREYDHGDYDDLLCT